MSTPPPPEERRRATTERQRPGTSYNSWILLTVTVTLVLFMGIITWYGRFPFAFSLEEPSDHELVYQLSRTWQARWPQIPGPPEAEVEQARALSREGDVAGSVAALTRALALDPDAPEPLLLLAIASFQLPDGPEGVVSTGQAIDLVEIVAETDPDHPLLPVAQAWLRLAAGESQAALELLTDDLIATPEGALARLRLLQATGQDPLPAAEALLVLMPGNIEACTILARQQVTQRELVAALRTLEGCPGGSALDRLRGDALDGVGEFRAAYDAYLRAGAHVHAAAIAVQEGWRTPADEAVLAADTPEAALHRLWWGVLAEDLDRIEGALAVLTAAAVDGVQFDVARAAGLLALQRPQEALALVEGTTAPEAQTLVARALWMLGDKRGAQEAALRALKDQGRRVRLRLLTAAYGVHVDPLGISELEHALYAGERQREMPWPALIPASELAELEAAVVEAELREPTLEAALVVLEAASLTEAGAERLEAERTGAGVMAWRRSHGAAR